MKREAEQYLIKNCDSLFAAILRPGLVYHDTERPWSVPLGLLSNLSHTMALAGSSGPPGTNLRVLAEHTIQEAVTVHTNDLQAVARHKIITAAQMKTSFPL